MRAASNTDWMIPATARARHRRLVFTAAVAVALLGVASGCSSDDSPTAASAGSGASAANATASRTSACRPVPAAGPAFDWFPADLPLPAGTYPTEDVSASGASSSASDSDSHRGFLVVPGSVTDFSAFIAREWTAAGWTMGKGDAERGEAEGGFRKGDFGGVYRVRDVYCDPKFSELLLAYGKGATDSQ